MIDLAGSGTDGQRHAATPIANVVPQGPAEVSGVISSTCAMLIGGAPACRYTLTDGTGELDLLFLGRVEIAGMRCGRRCRAEGTVGKRDGRLVLWNPRYWLEPTGPERDCDTAIAVSAEEAVAIRTAALDALRVTTCRNPLPCTDALVTKIG